MIILTFSCFLNTSLAGVISPLFIQGNYYPMGGALSAIIEDGSSLFYNPAGLAQHKNIDFNFLNIDAIVSNDLLKDTGKIKQLRSFTDNPNVLDAFMGDDFFARLQGSSVFSTPRFAIAAVFDTQLQAMLHSPVLPFGTLTFQTTYGMQTGYGKKILTFSRKKGQIRAGIALKYLIRQGQPLDFYATQLFNLDTSTISSPLTQKGSGLGIDIGTQGQWHVHKKITLYGAWLIQDIGDTSFSGMQNPQKQNIILGWAGRYSGQKFSTQLSFEKKQLFESQIDWRKTSYAGLEFKVPILSLFLGLYQMHPSYGFSLNLFFLKIKYTLFTEELGIVFAQNPKSRQFIEAKINFAL